MTRRGMGPRTRPDPLRRTASMHHLHRSLRRQAAGWAGRVVPAHDGALIGDSPPYPALGGGVPRLWGAGVAAAIDGIGWRCGRVGVWGTCAPTFFPCCVVVATAAPFCLAAYAR